MTPKEIRPGWKPRDMADHYHTPRDLEGTGEIVAIIDLGEIVDPDELRKDFEKLGVPMPELVIVDDHSPAQPGLSPAAIETHIDLEIIGTLCPAATLRLYRCALNYSAMANAISQAVKDEVHVISISWGAAEKDVSSGTIRKVEDALAAATGAGITVCAAAGDFGAVGLIDGKTMRPENTPNSRANCMFPASSPNVLACGGTELVEASGKRQEIVWNNTATGGLATGGGVSEQFDLPDWQAQLKVTSANQAGGTGRILPDVSALAAMQDWDFEIPGAPKKYFGGTSAVAPFYAALITMANQMRVRKGKKRLGFLNSRLYDVARNKGDVFESIRIGNNKVAPDGPGYEAEHGFDACTGWGVPRADKLISALVGLS
ncbi:S53 family peptidase [Primorskyibacter sp. S87]|uniref:S53 family peptidase n=1 Tax=Primorskyibacter sp. S87 TaxID=3415126 RepID=UPI003C7E6635